MLGGLINTNGLGILIREMLPFFPMQVLPGHFHPSGLPSLEACHQQRWIVLENHDSSHLNMLVSWQDFNRNLEKGTGLSNVLDSYSL